MYTHVSDSPNLHHLGMQSLSHLYSSMSEQHRPISVDMEEGSCLVKMGGGKGEAVLVGYGSKSPLLPAVQPRAEKSRIEYSTIEYSAVQQ